MTNIQNLTTFGEQFDNLVESKENPEEWYVLIGNMVGEYSVKCDDIPGDHEEHQQQLPPEDRDATEDIDGFMQIGNQGWSSDAFAEDCNFVGEYSGYGEDKIDTRLMNMLLVHEDMLTEEALDVALGEFEGEQEAEA